VTGLPERAAYSSPDGRVIILEAGRATLEIADPNQAEFIDRVEVGRRVAGHIRVAFEVDDSAETAGVLAAGGAELVAPATRTPWQSMNARLDGPGGLQHGRDFPGRDLRVPRRHRPAHQRAVGQLQLRRQR
jgi:hypothetical protein